MDISDEFVEALEHRDGARLEEIYKRMSPSNHGRVSRALDEAGLHDIAREYRLITNLRLIGEAGLTLRDLLGGRN